MRLTLPAAESVREGKNKMDKFYTVKQASELLHVTGRTVKNWEKAGKISCIRTEGNHRRISQEEIERILKHPIPSPEKPIDTINPSKVKNDPENRILLQPIYLQPPIQSKKKKEEPSGRHNFKNYTYSNTPDTYEITQAKNEVMLIKLRHEKERLLSGETKAQKEMKLVYRKNQWIEKWVQYALWCFPVDRQFELTGDDPEDVIPPDLKLLIKRITAEILRDMDINASDDEIKYLVEFKIVELVRRKTLYPQMKRDAIENALYGLNFPYDMDEYVKIIIKNDIEKILTELPSYDEDKIWDTAERLFNEKIIFYKKLKEHEETIEIEKMQNEIRTAWKVCTEYLSEAVKDLYSKKL